MCILGWGVGTGLVWDLGFVGWGLVSPRSVKTIINVGVEEQR